MVAGVRNFRNATAGQMASGNPCSPDSISCQKAVHHVTEDQKGHDIWDTSPHNCIHIC